jgi:hypothetical protein
MLGAVGALDGGEVELVGWGAGELVGVGVFDVKVVGAGLVDVNNVEDRGGVEGALS